MKKVLCLVLAITVVFSLTAFSATSPAAYSDLSPGGYGVAGEYTPSDSKTQTVHLMFAMPACWQNNLTEDPRCGGAAGCYWWTGYDTPDAKFGHGWPGYKAVKENEEGVDNLWGIDVPTYGNGEAGDAMQIIWNNYLDCGTDSDPARNPFYNASQQSRDFLAQYYSRIDEHETYDMLFRYAYLKAFEQYGIDVLNLDIRSDNFWVQANMIAAAEMGRDWYKLSSDARTYQVDEILDQMDNDLDFSEFGDYADNFFNEDLVGDLDLYPYEDSNGFGMSFTFANMVFVVNLDPSKMSVSPLSGRISWDGDFYFYYGNGDYGSWPTKELNEQMGGVSGNFTQGEYVESVYDPSTYPTVPSATSPYTYPTIPPATTGKIYFQVPGNWTNFKYITFYLYDKSAGEIITWGSKKGYMTDEGNGIWSYDIGAKGVSLGSNYGCIFTADWGIQTCDLILGPDSVGDTAYCTGELVENNVDSNKKSYVVKWKSGKYGNPKCFTSLGNVIGDCYWQGETGYSLMVKFLSSTGKGGIVSAKNFTGKTDQQILDYVAEALELSNDDIRRAIAASGRSFAWTDGSSTPDSGSSSGGNSPSASPSFTFVKLSDGTYELTDYSGESKFVALPDSVRERVTINGTSTGSTGYVDVPVTSVGEWVLYNNKYVQNVYIPDSITHIGMGAFYGCVGLKKIEIPDSVTSIDASAFEKCLALKKVTLGDGITEIPDDAFSGCRNLSEINIPESVTHIGEEAFFDCRSLKELVLPEGLQTIGSMDSTLNMGVFEDCRSLEKIRIPASVDTIGENAFENCKKLTVFGRADSVVEGFAEDNDINFKRYGRTTESGKIVGDLNNDWDVNIIDATIMQNALAEMEDFNLNDKKTIALLDTNNDGKANVSDVTRIQRYIAEYIPEI